MLHGCFNKGIEKQMEIVPMALNMKNADSTPEMRWFCTW
jgi:hypothetical protein